MERAGQVEAILLKQSKENRKPVHRKERNFDGIESGGCRFATASIRSWLIVRRTGSRTGAVTVPMTDMIAMHTYHGEM
jgi:hypothetical protein